jgi:hypothetical protein
MNRHQNSSERGFMTMMYALVITVLIGFAGLAIDVGYFQVAKRQAQSAADAAAMGALRELELGNTGNLTVAGRNDASLNGFTDGQNNTTVTINNPPLTGTYSGNNSAVEAIVRRTLPTYFMMIFGQNGVNIAARAVGRTTTTEGSIGGCIFALDQADKGTLSINGTSMTLNTSCSAIVDSSDDSAFTMGSGVTFNLNNHAHVGVVGNWAITGQATLWDSANNQATNPTHNVVYGDPLKNVPAPTATGLTVRSTINVTYGKNNPPAGNALQPGVYCGGVNFNDSNGVWYTLNPGVYVIAGGGMTVNSAAMLKGTGVTFYNTSASAGNMWGCTSASPAAPLSISGQATLNFTAPTSGSLVGMLFFDDRSNNYTPTNKIVGGASSSFDGALYFKNTNLQFAGTNATNGYMVIVAYTISINGTTTMGNNYASLSNPNPFAPSSTGGGLVE